MLLEESFCSTTRGIWIFIGQIVLIFKIIIPVILVILGVVALGKAVISDDDKEIKSAVTKLIKKVIIAVIIFFIPQLVKGIFNLIGGYGDKGDAADYVHCIDYVVDRKDVAYNK